MSQVLCIVALDPQWGSRAGPNWWQVGKDYLETISGVMNREKERERERERERGKIAAI